MIDCPSFEDFHGELYGYEPFPWQSRLAKRVVATGWPGEIGVPTGLGKTTCLDIAIWSIAAQADLQSNERTVPTRVWYVVNRRLLVDTAHDHALRLAEQLQTSLSSEHKNSAVAAVASRLAEIGALGTSHGPLHVTRLRGGVEAGHRVPDPSQPAVILSTVPMFASRWLFRGYGVSTSMRPIESALAGIDSLILVDEAHLAHGLLCLHEPLQQCDVGDASSVIPASRKSPVVVSMTATGSKANGERFDLDEDDRNHAVIRQRLEATKEVSLENVATSRELSRLLATQVKRLLAEADVGASCVVFVNQPSRAREVETLLRQDVDDVDIVLLTGLTREREASRTRSFLLDPSTGIKSGALSRRQRQLVVVATQTLEVGADLDFDFLVTESASVRALTQRFGRLNRLGKKAVSKGVICHADDEKHVPFYGAEVADVWRRLQSTSAGLTISFSPSRIAAALGIPADQEVDAPELLPSHLWEWVKTSFPPPGEAPTSIFYEGYEESLATVAVAWRAHVPSGDQSLYPPLISAEMVDIPLRVLRDALKERNVATVRRVNAELTYLETVDKDVIRPGDQIVFATRDGMYDAYGWNSRSTAEVFDVSPLYSRTLIVDGEDVTLRNLIPFITPATRRTYFDLAAFNDESEVPESALLNGLLIALRGETPNPELTSDEWEIYLSALDNRIARPIDSPAYVMSSPKSSALSSSQVRLDAFDELSFLVTSATLDEHLGSVGALAGKIGRALGCPDPLVRAVQVAGRLHDLGKCDSRFQRWLDPTAASESQLAKSSMVRSERRAAQRRSGWPLGEGTNY